MKQCQCFREKIKMGLSIFCAVQNFRQSNTCDESYVFIRFSQASGRLLTSLWNIWYICIPLHPTFCRSNNVPERNERNFMKPTFFRYNISYNLHSVEPDKTIEKTSFVFGINFRRKRRIKTLQCFPNNCDFSLR
jgi:hypothetical protein